MRLAIMQPYFLPYLGYFQLIRAVDLFVVYDDIEFTKNGWIHRNRILLNGCDALFSLPLKKASDYLDVNERELADIFPMEQDKIRRRLEAAYRKAPYFSEVMPVIERCLKCTERNLFAYVFHSIVTILEHLAIGTCIRVSSTVGVDRNLKGQDRVLATCKELQASSYINPPGGKTLYDRDAFLKAGLDLQFLEPMISVYRQFEGPFVPNLSIVDVMMFNSSDQIHAKLNEFKLV